MSRLTLFFFFVFSLTSHADPVQEPTLLQDCKMGFFQTSRMPSERRTFWSITEDYEIHDLKAERAYNKKLTDQVVLCYKKAEADELSHCDFNKMRLDERQLNPVVPDSEYFHWRVSEDQGRNRIYPAKLNYAKTLAARINTCFTKENLACLTQDGFYQLYHTVQTLAGMVDQDFRNLNLLPRDSTIYQCEYCNTKDSESTYTIRLNGLRVVKDYLGRISIQD